MIKAVKDKRGGLIPGYFVKSQTNQTLSRGTPIYYENWDKDRATATAAPLFNPHQGKTLSGPHPSADGKTQPWQRSLEYKLENTWRCHLVTTPRKWWQEIEFLKIDRIALLVKFFLKCTISGGKRRVVSHSRNLPSDICCMFWVGYDTYFAQKKNMMTLIRHFWPNLQQMFKKG